MEKKKKLRIYRFTWGAAGLLLACGMVLLLSISYVGSLKATLRSEAASYLSEISGHISESLDTKVNSGLRNLQTIADALEQYTGSGSSADTFLQKEAERYGYMFLYITDNNGINQTKDKRALDIRAQDCFRKALTGQPATSDVVRYPLDQRRAVLYTVPIYHKGSISGTLSAVTDLEKSRSSLMIETFDGEGFCHIVKRNGDVILSSQNKNAVHNVENSFTLWEKSELESGVTVAQLRRDFFEGKEGSFLFQPDSMVKQCNYQPLPINDWYLLTVVPTKIIDAKTSLFVNFSAILCVAVALLFIILLLLITLQQKRSRRELQRLAFIDPVTDGPNAKRFELDALQLIRKAPPCSYALISKNMKGFKLINETSGQDGGNQTLHYVYTSIQEMLNSAELVCRAYSDHFMVLLQYSNQAQLQQRLLEIGENINRFNQEREDKYYLNFAMGVFVIDNPSMDMVTIQDRANTARKSAEAIHADVGEPVYYQDTTRLLLMREKELENRMATALINGEFVVYMQPKYSLKQQTVAGAEALVRWQDPEKGLIPPNDFIPLFERNGFIIQLDYFVFEEVCKTIQHWIQHGVSPIPVSVNLSRVHLDHPIFIRRYEALCQTYGIPTSLIEIEVTETLAYEKADALQEIIAQLHTLGFTCSLDDFGSGYSSLNMLKDVPVDVLKLDRAFFLSKQFENDRSDTVVRSIITLAGRLSMKTVAEGVEDAAQIAFLRQADCDMVQGFVFSKPLPISDFEKLAFGKPLSS